MSTDYRVDRANSRSTPVGMNSLLYVGDSLKQALAQFHAHKPGLNPWNQPDLAYGVILSVWNGREYIVKKSKFPL